MSHYISINFTYTHKFINQLIFDKNNLLKLAHTLEFVNIIFWNLGNFKKSQFSFIFNQCTTLLTENQFIIHFFHNIFIFQKAFSVPTCTKSCSLFNSIILKFLHESRFPRQLHSSLSDSIHPQDNILYYSLTITLTSARVLSVTSMTNSGAGPLLLFKRKFRISDKS